MRIYLILIAIIILLSACSLSNSWTGFYYPDKDNINDESTWVIQPGLKSLEDCQRWVKNTAKANDNYDYECGYKCRYEEDYGMTICKETKR